MTTKKTQLVVESQGERAVMTVVIERTQEVIGQSHLMVAAREAAAQGQAVEDQGQRQKLRQNK